jgi:hypothetical protein
MLPMTPITEKDPRPSYHRTIATFKQQQWQVTNYGLALYAAIASVPKFIGDRLAIWEL